MKFETDLSIENPYLSTIAWSSRNGPRRQFRNELETKCWTSLSRKIVKDKYLINQFIV